jgi:hypothetical protein
MRIKITSEDIIKGTGYDRYVERNFAEQLNLLFALRSEKKVRQVYLHLSQSKCGRV